MGSRSSACCGTSGRPSSAGPWSFPAARSSSRTAPARGSGSPPGPHARGAEMAGGPDAAHEAHEAHVTPRAIAVAACREMLEEACLLPLDPPLLDEGGVDALRREAASAPGGLAAALERRGRRLRLDRLVPWARWITPEAESRRYDTRFFLLELPAGQIGHHDDHETTMSFWASPTAVLEKFARGEIFLAPPTTRTLRAAGDGGRRARRPRAGGRAVAPAHPVPGASCRTPTRPYLALPGDPAAHPVRERRSGGGDALRPP